MSDSPRSGVVDRNCRVHGLENLYVASSAVFPTTGYANPTLSIVAMAARIAAHVAKLQPVIEVASPSCPRFSSGDDRNYKGLPRRVR